LAFLVRRASVFTIPKSSSAAHVEENAAAGKLVLTEDDLRKLDRAFPARERRSLPMI
jgi:diketogulonate reductase-like aldo/keto reductase